MLIEAELSPNLIKFFRVTLFDIYRITEENLILSNNYIAAPVSGLSEQYLPIYARRRGTNTPETARAAVTVLFTINRPIVRRLHADPFGDTESRRRRLVINHASSQIATSRLHHVHERGFLPPTNCVQVEQSRRLEGVRFSAS